MIMFLACPTCNELTEFAVNTTGPDPVALCTSCGTRLDPFTGNWAQEEVLEPSALDVRKTA